MNLHVEKNCYWCSLINLYWYEFCIWESVWSIDFSDVLQLQFYQSSDINRYTGHQPPSSYQLLFLTPPSQLEESMLSVLSGQFVEIWPMLSFYKSVLLPLEFINIIVVCNNQLNPAFRPKRCILLITPAATALICTSFEKQTALATYCLIVLFSFCE